MMHHDWTWSALVGLGAFHGLNPAMGWLFAVALGLQERRRGAVFAALPPIALGHALSVAMMVAVTATAAELLSAVSPRTFAVAAGVLLIAFGTYRLVRTRHPRWVGMQVGFRDLTLWSWMMSTAHGAGLMLLPILLRSTPVSSQSVGHTMSMTTDLSESALAAVALHSVAMLGVMTAVAVLVYETVGVGVLRKVWVRVDWVWGVALVGAGVWLVVG